MYLLFIVTHWLQMDTVNLNEETLQRHASTVEQAVLLTDFGFIHACSFMPISCFVFRKFLHDFDILYYTYLCMCTRLCRVRVCVRARVHMCIITRRYLTAVGCLHGSMTEKNTITRHYTIVYV